MRKAVYRAIFLKIYFVANETVKKRTQNGLNRHIGLVGLLSSFVVLVDKAGK